MTDPWHRWCETILKHFSNTELEQSVRASEAQPLLYEVPPAQFTAPRAYVFALFHAALRADALPLLADAVTASRPLVDLTAPASPLPAARDHMLHAYPRGPRVPASLVSMAIVVCFSERFSERHLAEQIIAEAAALRQEADAGATVIKIVHLPKIDVVGSTAFWHAALNEARRHGPRMMAALLHQLGDTALSDKELFALRRLSEGMAGPPALA